MVSAQIKKYFHVNLAFHGYGHEIESFDITLAQKITVTE